MFDTARHSELVDAVFGLAPRIAADLYDLTVVEETVAD